MHPDRDILFIRSRAEYVSVVWHSLLTAEQTKKIENIQKTSLKIILGQDYIDYPTNIHTNIHTNVRTTIHTSIHTNILTNIQTPIHTKIYSNIHTPINTTIRSTMQLI